ncbi:hypothetical protein ACET3Z_000884 [Daucus carota]
MAAEEISAKASVVVGENDTIYYIEYKGKADKEWENASLEDVEVGGNKSTTYNKVSEEEDESDEDYVVEIDDDDSGYEQVDDDERACSDTELVDM